MPEQRDHSVKVPRLFKNATKIVKTLREEGGSVKELVYGSKHPNIQGLYALVVETIRREKQLNEIIEQSKILEQEQRLDPWLARVLITELLWGKKRLSGESKPIQTILSYQSSFKVNVGMEEGSQIQKKDSVKGNLPRYARVNTLYMTVEQAVEYFRDEGWVLARKADKELFPTSDHFRCDPHVPELLIFPPGTQMFKHPLYRDRSILLQDKASCLASRVLLPKPGSIVLDMCAAPGMKTTHLAAIMKNKGTIYAVEKDVKRYKTLCKFVEETGASCVKILNEDSVQLKAESVPDVEYILVDPSCSGSGIVGRPEVGNKGKMDDENSQERLRRLVGFQKRILKHALTAFPSARRVLYSTCSVLASENEEVIWWAMNQMNEPWHLVNILPEWKNRGCEEKYPGIGEFCVYASTEKDLTNGFFMAMLEREGVHPAHQRETTSDNSVAEEQIQHFSSIEEDENNLGPRRKKEKKEKAKKSNAVPEQLSPFNAEAVDSSDTKDVDIKVEETDNWFKRKKKNDEENGDGYYPATNEKSEEREEVVVKKKSKRKKKDEKNNSMGLEEPSVNNEELEIFQKDLSSNSREENVITKKKRKHKESCGEELPVLPDVDDEGANIKTDLLDEEAESGRRKRKKNKRSKDDGVDFKKSSARDEVLEIKDELVDTSAIEQETESVKKKRKRKHKALDDSNMDCEKTTLLKEQVNVEITNEKSNLDGDENEFRKIRKKRKKESKVDHCDHPSFVNEDSDFKNDLQMEESQELPEKADGSKKKKKTKTDG